MSTYLETAIFGGGCFWCTEAVFKRLRGVSSVISGYSGGKTENPSYDQVVSSRTGHVEVVKISFDPKVISFDSLLEVFWATHDPTSLNQQGADIGEQYQSVIFYANQDQQQKAISSKTRLEKSKEFSRPIVTQILPFKNFSPAEEYHQNFYDSQPASPYCRLVINPKINKLLEKFSRQVKEEYRREL